MIRRLLVQDTPLYLVGLTSEDWDRLLRGGNHSFAIEGTGTRVMVIGAADTESLEKLMDAAMGTLGKNKGGVP